MLYDWPLALGDCAAAQHRGCAISSEIRVHIAVFEERERERNESGTPCSEWESHAFLDATGNTGMLDTHDSRRSIESIVVCCIQGRVSWISRTRFESLATEQHN